MTTVRPDDRRRVHLVGTVPSDDARAAFDLFASTLDGHLPPWIPDGETGDRLDWVQRIIDGLRDHPDLRIARDGDWSDYQQTPYFAVAPGRKFTSLEFDYTHYFKESWPEFQRFRSERQGDHVLQVGVPSHVDLALIAFGFKPGPGLRHMAPFRDATVREITRIHAVAGDEAVFQLEIPIPLVLLGRAPSAVRPVLAKRLAAELVKVVRRAPRGARFGIHLCHGDMNHRSMADPEDAGSIVQLANALVRAWPPDQRLDFIHAPFARGEEPPSLDPEFYAPLSGLRLPRESQFAAGLVHEGLALAEMLAIRNRVENLIGRKVDVGAACGLGRRDRDRAETNLRLSAEVAAG